MAVAGRHARASGHPRLDASVEIFRRLSNMSLDSMFFASPPKIC
jgi:hypothetical protein